MLAPKFQRGPLNGQQPTSNWVLNSHIVLRQFYNRIRVDDEDNLFCH